jgi:hypothetical protein
VSILEADFVVDPIQFQHVNPDPAEAKIVVTWANVGGACGGVTLDVIHGLLLISVPKVPVGLLGNFSGRADFL